ncbi:hypothetical protein IBE48_07780 [Francisella philomiragia]|uniref:Sel1 repeat family protein n=1 Tax=Francisella philomiragia TaxID=28110 RepID=A0AAW3DBT9_9GAMM|nr:hypothetical protein [Francisella philomiragia]KFJ42817.1 sel1 repeat family protein [Francisella philomiragia]MBK2255337.1 hypothetical protein [Francisella philomiragia]MBK2273650.1 hypothetical protein [Francisella philomiragia]MBK2277531.1 hypothetical protein [Francisella philomiragia]MBK2281473.1 hypothetical protein [Francisella philomiragia]
MKKLIITFAFLFVSVNAFADINDCESASKNESWQKAIEYCKPLANDNNDALGLLVNAYTQEENGKLAQKYSEIYIKKSSPSAKGYANFITGLGNLYYFKDNYGATRDIKKGLEYITKGAQLGSIYTGGDNNGISTNIAISYFWYKIASINGNQKAKNSPMLQNEVSSKNMLPYCIAMGQQLVAESYINGEAGLPKSDNQAKNYLIQAIELYKEAKQPSEDELKYCPPQKGLDLASAEKLLEKIK